MPETAFSATNEQLALSGLEVRDFRNYERFDLDGIGPLTILTGPNAVGKTSLVEAVQMMTALKSFRTAKAAQMVRWGAPRAQVTARLQSDRRQLDLELSIDQGKRSYKLNGKHRRIAQLKGLLPAVAFTPDDLRLAKDSDASRRDALDDLGAQISKNFYQVRSDYARLLKQKNHALKDEQPDAFIASIDDVLVRVGAQVLAHRLIIVAKLQPYFRRFYREITGGEEAELRYRPCWLSEDDGPYAYERERAQEDFRRALVAAKERERAQHRAVVGPQADKAGFYVNGHDAIHYASQGQQRSVVLAYKLAEAAVIQDTLGQKPLLLLDDVMSELDERRRGFFMEFIADDIQTFITTTNLDYFTDAMKSRARIVRLGGAEA